MSYAEVSRSVERVVAVLSDARGANVSPTICVAAIDRVYETLKDLNGGVQRVTPVSALYLCVDGVAPDEASLATAIWSALGDLYAGDGMFVLGRVKDGSPLYDAVKALGNETSELLHASRDRLVEGGDA